MMVFANVVGSIANEMLAPGLIMSGLMALILVGICVNIYNGVKKFKAETLKLQHDFQNKEEQLLPEIKNDSEQRAMIELKETGGKPDSPEEEVLDEELNNIKKYEGSNVNPKKLAMFLLTVLVTTLHALVKGSRSFKELLGIQRCQISEYVFLGSLTLAILIIQIISVRIVYREQTLKVRHGYHFSHEILFSGGKIVVLVLFSFVIGFLANILGLGGGFVIFPMLILVGTSPLVASATTMFLILLSKLVAASLALSSGNIKFDYTFFTVFLVIISVIIFSKLTDFILKK